MAGVTLGFLKYVLGLDTIAFKKGMTAAERDLVVMQKRFDKVGQQMVGLGKNLTVGLTLPLTAFAAKGIKEAQETQAAMAQVNAALTSMGPVAGRTAEQLSKAANAFEGSSLFEADQILSKVTANLLTFGNISEQAFDRAQQAAIDLATRMGTDLQSATLLVGKALNDPIKGMGALGRAGIQFTAAQKETIKAMVAGGNAAGAQALILKELERQFGGAAAAAQNADPWNKATDAFNQMAESIGTLLLPAIGPLANALSSVANAFASLSPETQKWVAIAGLAVAAAGPLLIAFGSMVTVVAKIGPLVLALTNAWKALATVLAVVRIASVALLPTLIPFLAPLAAIAAAAAAVYVAWKNWDKIVGFVTRVYTAVKSYIGDKLNAVWDSVANKIQWIGDKFKWLYDVVVGHSYIPDMVDEIGSTMASLDEVLVAPVTSATTKAAEAFRNLQQQTKGILDRLFPEAAALNQYRAELATLEAAMKSGILTADKYAAALDRLGREGLTDESLGVLDTGSIAPGLDGIGDVLGGVADKLPEIIDRTKAWQEVVHNVATDLGALTGDWLAAFIDGSAKLKDLWKGILSYAIQALTSQNGPLQAIFGGARAMGGPVDLGKTYLVGERGPELFTPSRSGRIIPNQQLGMARSGALTQNFNFPNGDYDSFRRSERQAARIGRRMLQV